MSLEEKIKNLENQNQSVGTPSDKVEQSQQG